MLNITKDCINKYWFQFGILFLIIYFLPYIFLGENSFITVWENLDSGVAGMPLLVATGWLPDHELLINKVMNGLSINVFHSKLNFIFLIFYFLFNLLEGERGLFSFFKKKEILITLQKKENVLTNGINDLKFKNTLLSDKLDLDYVETLIREKFLFGKEGETLYIIKKDDN